MSNFEYTPSKNYDLLVKQFRSMAQLVRALEAEGTMLKKHVSLLENQLALSSDTEINALREANEQLTGYLLAKEVERDALKAELAETKTAYAHMIKLKDELCTELEAARRQEPIAREIPDFTEEETQRLIERLRDYADCAPDDRGNCEYIDRQKLIDDADRYLAAHTEPGKPPGAAEKTIGELCEALHESLMKNTLFSSVTGNTARADDQEEMPDTVLMGDHFTHERMDARFYCSKVVRDERGNIESVELVDSAEKIPSQIKKAEK